MRFINFEIKNNVGIITLNRTDKFNSFVKEMAFELQETLLLCEEKEEIRSVYLTGTGKAFCAGQDLGEAIDPNGPKLSNIVKDHYNPIILKLRNIKKPVVCAVNGVAAGAGANIALACDITLAGKTASFIQAFSKIGLIPDCGGTYFLPRIIGLQKSAALMFLADKVMAEDAEKMGMIYQCVADDDLQKVGIEIATKLAKMPTKAIGFTKALLNESYQNTLEQQLALEGEKQTLSGQTEDYKEGIDAFLSKRQPIFKGK